MKFQCNVKKTTLTWNAQILQQKLSAKNDLAINIQDHISSTQFQFIYQVSCLRRRL